jgi:hypothetical protein
MYDRIVLVETPNSAAASTVVKYVTPLIAIMNTPAFPQQIYLYPYRLYGLNLPNLP